MKYLDGLYPWAMFSANSNVTHPADRRPALYFDSHCPICRREIAHYQRLDCKRRRIEWVDLVENPNALESFGVSFEDAMRQIHAVDPKGRLLQGIDAFILIWRELPFYSLLALLASFPLLHSVFGWCYQRFANWRFKRIASRR